MGKNNIDFAGEAISFIKSCDNCYSIVGDFTDFFDRINHKYLKSMICKVLEVQVLEDDYYNVFKNITKYSWIDFKKIISVLYSDEKVKFTRKTINSKDVIFTKEQFNKYRRYITKNKKEYGVPQGSPISAVLSNIYMVDFDKWVKDYVDNCNGKYMRYCDDFIIVIPYEKNDNIEEKINDIVKFIHSRNDLITLQPEKTKQYICEDKKIYNHTREFETYIDYLGFRFNGSKIILRPKSISKYYNKMYRKAKTIVKNKWLSPKENRISAQNIYRLYSLNEKDGSNKTFIDYVVKSSQTLELDDHESEVLIKRHKQKN